MKKLIFFILLLNAVSGMAQSGWLNFAPGKYYGLWTTKWLQADGHFYWKGDTIHKELLLYADYKTDSVRFRPIGDPVWSPWYYAGHGGYTLPTASATVKGGIKVGTGLSIDSGTSVLSVFPDLYAPASGSANYVNVSPESAQSGNIWMSGTGAFGGNMTFGESATTRRTANFLNTGGNLYVGVESLAGGGVFSGSSAYSGIIGTDNATNLQFATNGIIRATINVDGTTEFLSNIQSTTAKFTTGAAANTIFGGDATGLGSWVLKSSINLSSFTNDLGNYGGFLTSYTETDPTIYSWAKASTKPSYTYSEVGAEAAFTHNTGFNLPLGNTTGTVLEGRTFGTAANNNTGDFATAGHAHSGLYEPALGNPASNDYILSSSVTGVRSWVVKPTDWGNHSGLYVPIANEGKVKVSGVLADGLYPSFFETVAGLVIPTMDAIPTNGSPLPVISDGVYDALAGKAALAGSLSQAFSVASLTVEAGTYDWAITNSAGSLNFGQYSTNITFSSAGVSAPGVNLSGETASTLASFDASKNVKSLSTATYPSLTEVSYVKGVSSSIQTQLNAKVSGSGTSGRVAYWDGTSSISSDADLTFDGLNLVVGGNITGAEVYRGSSRTLKKNIHIYRGSAMDILNKTPIYTYNLKSNNSFGIGFIAEETDKWLSGEDRKAHLMGNHLGIITKALQEKDDEIQELKSRVERLEKLVNQIKRRK